MSFVYATIFTNKWFISLICGSYVIYVFGSVIILIRKIDTGLQLSSLVPDDTSTFKYLKMYEEYFSEYSSPLEVVLVGELDYFDRHFQLRIMRAAALLEDTSYTLKASFWLPAFLDFVRHQTNKELSAANSGTVMKKLARFLRHPGYSVDDGLMIKSSRLHIPLRNITRYNSTAEKRYSIQMLIYHVSFDLAEQDDLVPRVTVFNAVLAGFASTGATLLLIPSIQNCFLMLWATFSINCGVVALLVLCGTRLDIVSTIVIFLSIGYSVDFSSHILAHFQHFKRVSKDPLGKLIF
ncbi:unnamed protein product [Gongylonema pulchrum]|uniref:SSD domain-containing protein n=1 Tax=Gongylonema pulchrum TaxID=637853 RepID=A0A3P6PCS0_9BILA|nr:unnamed protein product [Gongylonema pulchrum]